jgi:hypothetical protein
MRDELFTFAINKKQHTITGNFLIILAAKGEKRAA